jgi:hypothetical protein
MLRRIEDRFTWIGKEVSNMTLQIRDAVGNEYGRPRDVVGESRTVFTSHTDAAFDVCFENIVTGCT